MKFFKIFLTFRCYFCTCEIPALVSLPVEYLYGKFILVIEDKISHYIKSMKNDPSSINNKKLIPNKGMHDKLPSSKSSISQHNKSSSCNVCVCCLMLQKIICQQKDCDLFVPNISIEQIIQARYFDSIFKNVLILPSFFFDKFLK